MLLLVLLLCCAGIEVDEEIVLMTTKGEAVAVAIAQVCFVAGFFNASAPHVGVGLGCPACTSARQGYAQYLRLSSATHPSPHTF